MSAERFPVFIPVKPWFQDHCFAGRTVFPAVETMLLLAAEAQKKIPGLEIRTMQDGRFAKFLEISPGKMTIEALIEVAAAEQIITVRLLSRKQLKIGSRIQEHGEMVFSGTKEKLDTYNEMTPERLPESELSRQIPAEQIYRELVPFGPAYRTLKHTLHIYGDYAWGYLKAPEFPLPDDTADTLGSPFPLDGALHAACVHGQQHVDFIPFPVGFAQRTVFRPTRPGQTYCTKVKAVSRIENELLFDLIIFDKENTIHEVVTGIRMRDVSGGRLKPPAWLHSGAP